MTEGGFGIDPSWTSWRAREFRDAGEHLEAAATESSGLSAAGFAGEVSGAVDGFVGAWMEMLTADTEQAISMADRIDAAVRSYRDTDVLANYRFVRLGDDGA
jgi:hypothetical protein